MLAKGQCCWQVRAALAQPGQAAPPCRQLQRLSAPSAGTPPLRPSVLILSSLVLQQQNFKQKVVALLRRFKVSDEVSGVRPHPWPTVGIPARPGLWGHLGCVLALL